MKTLFQGQLVNIWTDGYSPILFVRMFRIPASVSEKNELHRAYIQALRKISSSNDEVFCIFDFSEISLTEIKSIVTEYVFVTPEGMEDMIKGVSVIMPDNRLLAELRNWFRLGKRTDFRVSKSFYSALHYINTIRAEHLDYKVAL